ncbi:MAG: hypothetical protein HY815_24170 [Candidatus Riflebacteria bacterium]|nr:hypothetical protein [Candidatus Riflebacteria bacterium]
MSDPTGRAPDLSLVEIAASVVVLWSMVAWGSSVDPWARVRAFGGHSPFLAVSLSMAVSFSAYVLLLITVGVDRSARVAGALLGATICSSLFHTLLFLNQDRLLIFLLPFLASAAAIRTRCGLRRGQAIAISFCVALAMFGFRMVTWPV